MPKLDGAVEEIVYRNDENGWTVITLKPDKGKEFTCVGTMPFVVTGEHLLVEGEWVEHRDYGQQLKVTSYETVQPTSKQGIEKYLGSGAFRGIGPATAKLIVRRFGTETMDILENEPKRLLEIDGIGPKKLQMILESYEEQRQMQTTMLFMQSYGLSYHMALKIIKLFGESAVNVVRTDPYRLAEEVEGIGFRTADAIAFSLGVPKNDEHRIQCGVQFTLSEAVNNAGHTYLPYEELVDAAGNLLSVSEQPVEHAIKQLVMNGRIVIVPIDGKKGVYMKSLYDAEQDVALRMLRLLKTAKRDAISESAAAAGIGEYERETGVELAAQQVSAVMMAVREGVSIITGGPGTGKTTGIRCIIKLLKKHGNVELCAPTGRAAKRMSEATGCAARTIHRLLEYGAEGAGFQKNEDNPLDAACVIVDEMSMVDIFLMKSLLRALKPGTRLVMVGDADQLPSVGAGNVLKDLIECGRVPVVQLTEIFRQAGESMIVTNAHKINHGERPILNAKGSDFFMNRASTAGEASQIVMDLVSRRLPAYMDLDPMRDIQVMAPMKKGDAGVLALNGFLQEKLNPKSSLKTELSHGATIFRLGDKVMQTRNNYMIEWRKEDEFGDGVFNGDIGYIASIDRESELVTIRFDDGRVAEYGDADMDDVDLAYCVSVHKSQGSEFPVIVLPLVSGPPMLMTRNLLYTAVTRAKKLVVLVGRDSCVMEMVNNNQIMKRYTGLRGQIEAMFL